MSITINVGVTADVTERDAALIEQRLRQYAADLVNDMSRWGEVEAEVSSEVIVEPKPWRCTCGVKTPDPAYHAYDCPVFNQGGMTAK